MAKTDNNQDLDMELLDYENGHYKIPEVSAISRELDNLFIKVRKDWEDLFNGEEIKDLDENWNNFVDKTKDVINSVFGNNANAAAKEIAKMCVEDPAFKTEFVKNSKSAIDSHIDEINKDIQSTQSNILDDNYTESDSIDNQQVL